MQNKTVAFIFIIFVFFLPSISVLAGDDVYHKIIDDFMARVKKGESTEAIDFLYSGNPWISNKSDSIINLKNKFKNLTELVGQYNSHECLHEKVVAGRFAYVFYFVAYDRQPLKFIFEFYKPKNDWMIYSFAFNGELEDDIEKSALGEMFKQNTK
ncbi:hypothetical protein HYY75_04440 [bacterium]|nr:hypothetical protein [bacterium]